VLVVQNRTERHYDEDEEEALLTIAMVLAEVVAQGTLVDPAELDEPALSPTQAAVFRGEGLAEGLAIGTVVLHEPRVHVERMIADDPAAELKRLDEALTGLRQSVDEMLESSELDLAGESREVIEAYRLFANDQGWRERLRDAVHAGLTAEAAVERVQDETRTRFSRTADPYLRERLHDFDDLARRLMRHLSNDGAAGANGGLPEDAVVVARAMGPAELLDYGRAHIKGLVVEDASATSHIAIVARSLGVPMIGGAEGLADSARPGDSIVIDAEAGEVRLRPQEQMLVAFRAKQALRAQRVARFAAIRDQPAVTKDGIRIALNMNAGLMVDLPHLVESGADGIGLFRTELQFLIGTTMPRLKEQIASTARCSMRREASPWCSARSISAATRFRLTAVASARKIPRSAGVRCGSRSIVQRCCANQVRALIAAAAGRPLRILLPMVSEVAEFIAAKDMILREMKRAERIGAPLPETLHVGAMVEVPSLLFQLEQISALPISCPLVPTTCCSSCSPPTAPIPSLPAATTA